MMWLASFYNHALTLLAAMSTLSSTSGNTVVRVSRSQTVRSVDSFTVLATDDSPCACESFGGVSSPHTNGSICYCRCSISKPRFSFKIEGAGPKCVKDRTAVLTDHSG